MPEELIIPDLMDIPFRELWVLEYSEITKGFHQESLMEYLKTNLAGFMGGGRTGDWVPLGIFSSREECDQFYNMLINQMKTWRLSNLTFDQLLRLMGQ